MGRLAPESNNNACVLTVSVINIQSASIHFLKGCNVYVVVFTAHDDRDREGRRQERYNDHASKNKVAP